MDSLVLNRHALSTTQPRSLERFQGTKIAVSDSADHFAKAQTKQVIICLHAIGHGSRDFDLFRSHFREKYRVVAIDWPGQGLSEPDSRPASVSRYVEILQSIIESRGYRDFILFGNSIGGGVAIKFAAENRHLVKGLILSNPAGLDTRGISGMLFTRWVELKMQQGSRGKKSFASWFERYYNKILITSEAQETKNRIVSSAYELAPILEQAWKSFRSKENDLRSLLAEINLPVFVAWAEKDQVVRWFRNRRAIEKLKYCVVKKYRAGHSPFLETPHEFNSDVEKFLEIFT